MRDTAQESVKQEIENAFGDLALPQPDDVLGPEQGDGRGGRHLRDLLSGRDWRSLDATFLKRVWPSFSYLSDIGFRYYLPALLVRCLENPTEKNELIHSTLFVLAPSYKSLYYNGRDAYFDYRTSHFTPAQYGAVCSFLGYCFDRFPPYRTLSAQVLKWGWNRQEHPALQQSLEFYRHRHNYTYPEPKTRAVRDLVEQIRTAFAHTPYPGDNRLCGSEFGDEPAEQALELRGLDWRTIHPELLADCYTALSFLTAEGYRYFLPAFLIADLMQDALKIYSSAEPVFHLTRGLAPLSNRRRSLELLQSNLLPGHLRASIRRDLNRDWNKTTNNRHAAFTREERLAIIAYLQYLTTRESYQFDHDSIHEALECYWLKSV